MADQKNPPVEKAKPFRPAKPAAPKLPKDWVKVDVIQMERTVVDGKIKFTEVKKVKDITLPEIHLEVLNSQMENTLMKYKTVK